MSPSLLNTPFSPSRPLDAAALRADFPILARTVRGGKPLVYLDNAATSQKPRAVIDTLVRYYTQWNANIHRGVHELSEIATREHDASREKVRVFLNAPKTREIVFTRGATEAINLVAQSWGRVNVKEGDEILVTTMEHHANIVPWQMLCAEKGAKLRVAPMTDEGELILEEFEKLLTPRTRIAAFTHVSNALGTINPVARMIAMARAAGAVTLLDAAQSVPHAPLDVQSLGCDFLVFSGHKVYAPTGIGVLYGREALLNAMPPWQGGGDMIRSVTFEKTLYNTLPFKFEAGTPDIGGAIALGAAIDYLNAIGMANLAAHEAMLLEYGTALLSEIPGVTIIGRAREKAGVISFKIEGVHPHDVGTILDQDGIAIRTGHHCAQPVMERLGIPATARASVALYNTREDLEALARGVRKVQEVFA